MLGLLGGLLGGLLPGLSRGASAETVDVVIDVTDLEGRPVAGLPIRVVMGGEPDARSPSAGEALVTDARGRVTRTVEVKTKRRGIGLGIPFALHPAEMFEIGFEPNLGGLPILYWLQLDNVKQGVMSTQFAFARARSGRFESKLSFDWEGGSTNSAYRAPPLDENFDPVSDAPPARLGFSSQMLTPQQQSDGSRRWKLESRLKLIPYTPRGGAE